MKDFDLFVLARSVHVLSVVIWIGGVAFITSVLLPALKKLATSEQRIELFEQLEQKFSWQAKLTTILTGVSGLYMLYFLDAWHLYQALQFWWLHLMTCIWVVFTLVLFVFEPLFLHRWFLVQAQKDSKKTFEKIQHMHTILLTLSLISVFGAVAGAHGYL